MPAPRAPQPAVSASRAVPWRSIEQVVNVEPVGRVHPLHLGSWPGGEPLLPSLHRLGAVRSPGMNQKMSDPETAQQIEPARTGKEMNALEQDLMAHRDVAAVAVGNRFPMHRRGVQVLIFAGVLANGELD